MSEHNLFEPWICRFLLEHLPKERKLSRNTQNSYRETLALLFKFASRRAGVDIDYLSFQDLAPRTVRAFLDHLEQERGCSVATRNQRLSVMHSLAHFLSTQSVDPKWCRGIRGIPFKKPSVQDADYLETTELETLLRTPDPRTRFGLRDRALLLFLYNTGARAAEVARLKISSLQLESSQSVRIAGAGKQSRICPLWPATVALLRPLVAGRSPADPIFRCRIGKSMTRFGIYSAVVAHAKTASKRRPTMASKRISPHTLRNTTVVHLIRAGADIKAVHAVLGTFSSDERFVHSTPDTRKAHGAHSIRDLHQPPSTTLSDLAGFTTAERRESTGVAEL